MPITSFPATFDLSPNDLAATLTAAGLKKEWEETIHSFMAIVALRSWFSDRYGALLELRSRSNPDDPPDLDAVFEKETVSIEHTFFKPHPVGHAEAVAREVNPTGGRLLPEIGAEYTREELVGLAVGITPITPGSDLAAEVQAMRHAILESVKTKAASRAWDILCITDVTTFPGWMTDWVVGLLDEAVQQGLIEGLEERFVVFYTPLNHRQYFAAVLCHGLPIHAIRDGLFVLPRKPGFF